MKKEKILILNPIPQTTKLKDKLEQEHSEIFSPLYRRRIHIVEPKAELIRQLYHYDNIVSMLYFSIHETDTDKYRSAVREIVQYIHPIKQLPKFSIHHSMVKEFNDITSESIEQQLEYIEERHG